MKEIAYFIVMFICFFGNAAMAQTVKQKVAVYVTGDAEAGYKKVISSKMVSGITGSDSYTAVERTADFLSALTKEQDYQTSGAVSDNQIVKLGQQFGVRFVLAADVSVIFESMFISARMIDVQTGQIISATEASKVVNSMDRLTELSENVITNLINGAIKSNYGINIANVEIIGPFSIQIFFSDTFRKYIPAGYKIASKAEIETLIAAYRKLNKPMVFPIYTDFTDRTGAYYEYHANYNFTATIYESEDKVIEINKSFSDFSEITINPGYMYLVEK